MYLTGVVPSDPAVGMLFPYGSAIKKWCWRKREANQRETNPRGPEIPLKVTTALAQELFISFGKCHPLFSGCRVQMISGKLAEHSESWGGVWKEITRPLGKDAVQRKLSWAWQSAGYRALKRKVWAGWIPFKLQKCQVAGIPVLWSRPVHQRTAQHSFHFRRNFPLHFPFHFHFALRTKVKKYIY